MCLQDVNEQIALSLAHYLRAIFRSGSAHCCSFCGRKVYQYKPRASFKLVKLGYPLSPVGQEQLCCEFSRDIFDGTTFDRKKKSVLLGILLNMYLFRVWLYLTLCILVWLFPPCDTHLYRGFELMFHSRFCTIAGVVVRAIRDFGSVSCATWLETAVIRPRRSDTFTLRLLNPSVSPKCPA